MARTSHATILFLLAACAACGTRGGREHSAGASPPVAEFLVATQDSTFWVRSGATGIRVRGAPLILATFGGRWYEIFLADDDRSFERALLVGQQLYRRDLADGDSAIVYQDTVVPRIARAYARRHPIERPLGPDEEGEPDPDTQATSELEILGVHGPYLSYQLHVDVAVPGVDAWHETRRGVLDLRSGRASSLASLLPDSAVTRALREARVAFASMVDSVRRIGHSRPDDVAAMNAATWLSRQGLDASSFALTSDDGHLAAEFAIPERTRDEVVSDLVLDPVDLGEPAWWLDIRDRYGRGETDLDHWPRAAQAGYDVTAHYDPRGETAYFVLADSDRHQWPVATVATPVLGLYWLDRPPLDSVGRRALVRAFDEASLYDETTRTVRFGHRFRRGGGSRIRLAAASRAPSRSFRARAPHAIARHPT